MSEVTNEQAVPWPTSEGWWVIERSYCYSPWQPVYAMAVGLEFELCMIGVPQCIRRDSSLAMAKARPARFVKLLEQAPFTQPQERVNE